MAWFLVVKTVFLVFLLQCASFNKNKRLVLPKHVSELMRKILEVSETLVHVQETVLLYMLTPDL